MPVNFRKWHIVEGLCRTPSRYPHQIPLKDGAAPIHRCSNVDPSRKDEALPNGFASDHVDLVNRVIT